MPTKWYRSSRQNAEKQIKQVSARRRVMRQWLDSQKTRCGRCGYDRCVEALEFHHKDKHTKEINPSKMVEMGWGKVRMEREIEKCEVVCANCHREIHAGLA